VTTMITEQLFQDAIDGKRPWGRQYKIDIKDRRRFDEIIKQGFIADARADYHLMNALTLWAELRQIPIVRIAKRRTRASVTYDFSYIAKRLSDSGLFAMQTLMEPYVDRRQARCCGIGDTCGYLACIPIEEAISVAKQMVEIVQAPSNLSADPERKLLGAEGFFVND